MRTFILTLLGILLLAGPTLARGSDAEDPENAEVQEVESTEQEMGTPPLFLKAVTYWFAKARTITTDICRI